MSAPHQSYILPVVEPDTKTGEYVVRRGSNGIELARCRDVMLAHQMCGTIAAQEWPPDQG